MKMTRILAPVLAMAFAGLFAAHVMGQTPMDDPLDDHSAKRLDRMEKVMKELRAIVYQGRDTGKPVVIQPADTEGQIAALTEKVNDLETTLTRVNGMLESVNHTLDSVRDQSQRNIEALREENGALKDRLSRLDEKVEALTVPQQQQQPGVSAIPVDPNDPGTVAMATAIRAFQSNDYATAEPALRVYLRDNPQSPRAAEAHYYLGKILLSKQDYVNAGNEFIPAVRGYPQTSWGPDASLSLARAMIGMRKPLLGCQTLDTLAQRYPKAPQDVKGGAQQARLDAKCS